MGFRRLWMATTIDSLGSWLLVMAVPVQVYRLTGSAMSTGLALAVQAAPAVLIGPWAGVVIDRWPRRTILVGANLAAAGAVCLMLPGHVGFVFAGLLGESVAVCFLRPALRAVLPAVTSDLASANALTAFSDSVLRMIGPVIGTFLTARGWFELVVIVDAMSYVVAAVIIAGLALTPSALSATPVGVRQVLASPLLRGMLATSWVYWTGNAALTALLVPFTVTRLHGSGAALGYLIAGLGVGYVAGSAISGRILRRCGTRVILTVAYSAVGLCFLVMVNATTIGVAVVAATLAGVPGVIATVAITYRLQADTPDAVLGRVAATFYASDAVAAVGGALAAALVVSMTTLGVALNAFSVMVLGCGLLAAGALIDRRSPLGSAHAGAAGRPGRGRSG
ncbi:MFS transporter [Paractinoplanes lichenicola]|uniref:MFS transporter n=1 Tax=Paractinoplanes lichenicola TaxID=2802976 RepID=A0ABS1VYR8_9ACTN|nr:MFS transporter [Actinoplanes lichenicola]MBL7259573.1 MFS transporter [Actinoplanes lichenicola]